MEEKVKVRFGLKLKWPIANAAIFTSKVTNAQYIEIERRVNELRGVLALFSLHQWAEALTFERR